MIFTMLIIAWFQGQSDGEKHPLFYAFIVAVVSLFFRLLANNISITMLMNTGFEFLVALLYFYLLNYFNDKLFIWIAIFVGFPLCLLIVPLAL